MGYVYDVAPLQALREALLGFGAGETRQVRRQRVGRRRWGQVVPEEVQDISGVVPPVNCSKFVVVSVGCVRKDTRGLQMPSSWSRLTSAASPWFLASQSHTSLMAYLA